MTCPQCLEDTFIKMVDIVIECPSDTSKIDKAEMRKKEVKIIAANWSKVRYYCRNCGYRIWP